MKYFVIGFLLCLIVVGGKLSSLYLQPACDSTEQVEVFEVLPGSSFIGVTKRLKELHIISSEFGFKVLATILGFTKKIRVGEYAISCENTPLEILQTLASGKSITRPITFPEGYNMYEMAELVEKSGIAKKEEFLQWTTDKDYIRELLGVDLHSLEGYLFPETYSITKYDGAKKLIRIMVERFNRVFNKVRKQAQISSNYHPFSRHDAVILASIIEKETGAPEERPLISSVFHNRLRKKMRLQTDPTVLYGILDMTKEMKKNITKKDLQTPSRYNTYTMRGLPYGPIANPSEQALLSALSPESSSYLYFVSRNNGTHVFSETLAQHNDAVKMFQLDKKMREGRSWRDLKR